MLDLLRRQELAGGAIRVAEVVERLSAYAHSEGLTAALIATDDTPNARRLGALLSDQHTELADTVAVFLKGRKLRPVALAPGETEQNRQNAQFRVLLPERLRESNS